MRRPHPEPLLVVRIPLEGRPSLQVVSATDLDEARLRQWTRGQAVHVAALVAEWSAAGTAIYRQERAA